MSETMKYTREEHHEMFRGVTNIVQPPHPYVNNPYPIEKSELYTTWKQSDSNSWAHCGPANRFRGVYLVTYGIDLGYFNNSSKEKVLRIINHELTHITEGSHTQGSTHNPTFWNEVINNAKIVIDKREEVGKVVGEFDVELFIREVCEEPNNSMTDGRMETVEERKEKMWDALRGYRG